MEKIVRQCIEDEQLIPACTRVLVALSGGADSTALLYALCRLAPQLGFKVAAAHLNHRIRPGAAADAAVAAKFCFSLGIPVVFCAEDVPNYACTHKMGLEEAGRELRYRFLRVAAQITGSKRIATAHHLNDQAETLIMRLSRGTSVSGLKGIPLINLPFVRPLLRVERSQVEAYVRHHGLTYVDDESNLDCAFTRNRVRHKVLPLLEEVHPQAQRQLAQLAQQVSVEEDYWAQEVEKYLHDAQISGDAQNVELRIDYHATAALHPALRTRVMRALLGRVRGNLRGLESVHLHLLESIFTHTRPQMQFDLPDAWVARRYAQIVCRRSAPEIDYSSFCIKIDRLGAYALPQSAGVDIVMAQPSVEGPLCVEFDAAAVRWPLYIRDNRPGDRLRCVGMEGRKKLKNIFSEQRLELEQRRRVPVLCDANGEILWVMGVRRSCLAPSVDCEQAVVRVLFSPVQRKM
ncbi:MAG: tRNA lysidine(34) synthetase TilS [Desulfuromonadaceae bacterium]|nr:tRNA lysidine(34) synthetase TilS [Desulfuromonadaceae bacterium]